MNPPLTEEKGKEEMKTRYKSKGVMQAPKNAKDGTTSLRHVKNQKPQLHEIRGMRIGGNKKPQISKRQQ